MLIADTLQRRGLAGKFDVHLFTPEAQPLPVAGPALGGMVSDLLKEKGIAFHPGRALTFRGRSSRRLKFKDGTHEDYNLLVAVPPPPPSRGRAGFQGHGNEAGWIPVDRATLRTQHDRVYAIGDVATIGLPGRWRPDVPLPLPKAGVFAHARRSPSRAG